MASQVEIINMALLRIGSQRITSINDQTSSGQQVKAIYDLCVDFVINTYNWNSCKRRATLNRLVDAPAFEWSYQYQLPTNPKLLKVLEIYVSSGVEPAYAIEGDKLLTNASSVNLKYLAKLTNSEDFGQYLTETIISRLAYELAYSQTGSASVKERLQQEYLMTLQNNSTLDSQQDYNDITYSTTDIIDSRY